MPTPRTRKAAAPTLAPDDPLNVAAEQVDPKMAALLAAGFTADEARDMLAAKAGAAVQPEAQPPAPAPASAMDGEFEAQRAAALADYQRRMQNYVPPVEHETFTVTVPARTADYLRKKQAWHGEKDIGRVIEIIIRTYRQTDPVRLDLEATGGTGRASAFNPQTGNFG